MKSFHPILVRKTPDAAHQEVKVHIDWEGVSREDLVILARCALIHDLQFRLRGSKEPLPEVVNLVAREMVHHELPMMVQFQPQPRQFKITKEMKEAFANLSPQEMEELFA